MAPGHFNILRRGPHLIMELGLDLVHRLVAVKFLARSSEVRLHQVDILLVILHVDARVPDQNDSEVVEALGDFFALGEARLGNL